MPVGSRMAWKAIGRPDMGKSFIALLARAMAAPSSPWCPENDQLPHGRMGVDRGPTGFGRDAARPWGMSSEDRQRLQDGVRRQNQRSEERARGSVA